MRHITLPLSALLLIALPASSLAQSVSSSSSSSSSASSVSSSSISSSSSSSSSSMSSSSMSSSISSSRSSSSRSSSSRSSSSSSSRRNTGEPAIDDLDFTDIDLDRYDDAPFDERTDIAVSALTRIEVLRGNDDGTFRPDRMLNRAEFVQIVMRLIDDDGTVNRNCFPDVRPSDWFADPVCRAKALRIVRGNAQVGVSESMWRFEPSRNVQYEEAVKVLVKLFALPIAGDEEGADWYVPFINAAKNNDLDIPGLEPGDRITRGEMARLTLAFAAWSTGQLEDYRDAEDEALNPSSSSRSSRSSSSSSSRTSSRSSSSSSRSSTGSGVFDPDDDDAVRSSILVLGETTSPILAGVEYFSNSEPIDVDEITINFTGNIESVGSVLIYDGADGQQIGTATSINNSGTFRASIPSDRFSLPRREERTLYIRARTKNDDTGGVSGEDVDVASITLEGTGEWTNEPYVTTSTDNFPLSRTAFGMITSVVNASPSVNGVLIAGTERQIGDFRFTAVSPDPQHDVRITELRFTIEQTDGVTLSNVALRVEGSDEEHDCSVSSGIVTCTGISASIGEVDDVRTIRVFADVTIPGGADNPSLRLVLNEPGTPTQDGSVTWTDGTTTFDWLPLSQPVASGTLYD